MNPPDNIVLVERFPDVEAYCALRVASGLSPKSTEAATSGLAATLYGVSLVYESQLLGMGRIIGDGGCFFVVVDIAVRPDFQQRGLGKRIMDALDQWLRSHAPDSAHVSLFADGDARHLYARYGFMETGPVSVGMGYRVTR